MTIAAEMIQPPPYMPEHAGIRYDFAPHDPAEYEQRLEEHTSRIAALLGRNAEDPVVTHTILRLQEGDTSTHAVYADVTFDAATREHRTITDTLTGLMTLEQYQRWQKSTFNLGGEHHRRPRDILTEPRTVTLLKGDIYNFKRINDLLSYSIGDAALRFCAQEFHGQFRLGDNFIVYRRGGDEMDAAVADLSQQEAAGLYDRLMVNPALRTDNYKQQKIWKAILGVRARIEHSGGVPDAELRKSRADGRSKYEDYIYINGHRMCPLREIVVFDLGYAWGYGESQESMDRLEKNAEIHKDRVKQQTRLKAGGEYRDVTVL